MYALLNKLNFLYTFFCERYFEGYELLCSKKRQIKEVKFYDAEIAF